MLSLLTSLLIVSTSSAPSSPTTSVSFSPSGKLLAVGGRAEVKIINVENGSTVQTISGLKSRVTGIAWGTDDFFAVANGDAGQSGLVAICKVGQSQVLAEWQAHKDTIYAITVSGNQNKIITAGYDRQIKIWNLDWNKKELGQMKPIAELKDHSDAVYGLSIHPKGKLLASASADRSVKIWDIESGNRLYTLGDSTDWLYSVTWSPDGSQVAAAGVDKSLRIWKADEKSGSLEKSVFAHNGAVAALAYHPDGKSIITVGEDRSIKIWDSSTLKELVTIPAQTDAIFSLSVCQDGQKFAIGQFNGSYSTFNTKDGKDAGPKSVKNDGKPKEEMKPKEAVKAKMPEVQNVMPKYVVMGQKTLVSMTGQQLSQVELLSAAEVKIIEKTETEIKLELDATMLKTGSYSFKFKTKQSELSPISIMIERFEAVQEAGITDSISSAMIVPLDRVISGKLEKAGDADFYRFQAKAGQEIGAAVTASNLNLVLSVYDINGKLLNESAAGYIGQKCTKDGIYALSIRDREFRGGKDSTYRVEIGNIPVVTTVFPPVVTRGVKNRIELQGVNLPMEKSLEINVDADEKSNSLALSKYVTTTKSKIYGLDMIRVEDAYQQTVNGVITKPGEAIIANFAAKKGEKLIIEGLARRYNSPVDPQVEVLDQSGKAVQKMVLRCTAKCNLTFRDHDSLNPNLRMETWNEMAANDYVLINNEILKIRQLPGHPDDDCNFFQFDGKRFAFFDTTPAFHAKDSIFYKVEFHPPGTEFPPNGMPVFKLDYRNDDGGLGYGKDARIFFTATENGTYQVRLTDTRGVGSENSIARIVVRQPKPDFTIRKGITSPTVWKNGTNSYKVTIDRIDGFDEPVSVELADLDEGFTASTCIIEPGFNTNTLSIGASEKADTTKKPIKIIAKSANGIQHELMIESPKLDTAVIETKLNVETLQIKPGQETSFKVSIKRLGDFKKRVPLQVKGLPHGVVVQNIGLNKIMITENETEREIVIKAEPWVAPMSIPILVLAENEVKKVEYGAKPFTLEVRK